MDPRSSVVFICQDDGEGELTHAKGLLGCKIHEIAGGGSGIYGFGNEGVYEVLTGTPMSTADIACGSVGLETAAGVSSTVERTNSPPKPTGAGADKGSLYSWGVGDLGELGLGPAKTDVKAPMKVKYDTSVAFTQISSGDHHTCAIDKRGNLYAYGQNFNKQLGLYTKSLEAMQELRGMASTEDLLFTPRFVPFSLHKPIEKVACGAAFTVVATKSGQVWSWGAGECGQLGTGRCTFRELPAQVHLVPLPADTGKKSKKAPRRGKDEPAKKEIHATDVACGGGHVLVVTSRGIVYSWGLNKSGQLGLGDTVTRHAPEEVSIRNIEGNPVPLRNVTAFINVSGGLDDDGSVWTWGSAASNRLMRPALPPIDPNVVDGGNSKDMTASMSLRALGTTMRAVSTTTAGRVGRRGSSQTIALEKPSVWPYSAEAAIVEKLSDVRVDSFTFYNKGTAVLVKSTIQSLSPACGPLKGFSQLQITGYGFWDCDKIIVKFILQEADIPPRSCTARLASPNVISCRPPKLTEAGVYDVTVSMDGGKTFLPQVLTLRAYKETSVEAISPKMVDLRKTTTEKVVLSCKHFHIFEVGQCDDDGKQLWPTEENIQDTLLVKLIVSCSAPGALEPVMSEAICPAKLVPMESLSYDSVVNADGSVSQQESTADVGSVEGGPSIGSLMEGSSIGEGSYASSQVAFPDRDVECEVDFSTLGPAGSLIMIRGSFCLNGTDFGNASPDTSPIICHSFAPTGAAPSCCPAEERYTADNSPCDRDITILGSSFIPTSKLPMGMSIEALIRCEVPGVGKKGKTSTVEKCVPIECDSADVIRLQMPTLAELFAPGTQVPPKTPQMGLNGTEPDSRPMTAKSVASSGNVPEEATANVFFRLNVPPPTEKGKKSAKTPTSPKKGTAKKESVPFLAETPVPVFLYQPTTVTIAPQLTRRAGGAHLELRGTGECGGFNFRTSDAKVVFYRSDLDLQVVVPIEDTFMLGLDESLPVPEPIPEKDDDEEEDEEQQAFVEPETSGLGHAMSALSIDASSVLASAGPSMSLLQAGSVADDNASAAGSVVDVGSVASNHTIKPAPSVLSGIGEPHKIIIRCPEIFMPQQPVVHEKAESADVLENSVVDDVDVEGTTTAEDEEALPLENDAEEEVDHADGDAAAESVYVMPLDYMHVRVLLDGRSTVDDEHSTYVSLYYKVEHAEEEVEVAGGSASPGSECTVHIYSGATTSDNVVVRLRGEGGEPITTTGILDCDSSASPETVERYYRQEAEAAEAANLAAEAEANGTPDAVEAEEDGDEGGEDAEGEEEEEPEPKEEEGFLDVGGSGGTIIFECPDISELDPIMDGNTKRLYVDVSLDGGVTWDEGTAPRLSVK